MATKLSENSNYGRPSAKKLARRMRGWQANIRAWGVQRAIAKEIAPLRRQNAAANILESVGV